MNIKKNIYSSKTFINNNYTFYLDDARYDDSYIF